ncbi:MAG: response regulator transcription factor [Clostridiales bacterium]|nr:response regulator transcription factor [Clostridiales bacterium]
MSIKILLADDHSLMREGLKQLLEMEEDLKVVGQAGTGRDLLDLVSRVQADVILLDINLPDMSGLKVLELLREKKCGMRVIMLTIHDDWEYVNQAIKLGALGYLLKDVEARSLYCAIRDVKAGKTYVHPNLAWDIIVQKDKSMLIDKLTSREKEILSMVSKGLGNDDIAEKLVISDKTVRNHVSSIYRKLGVRDRTQAALLGMKSDIVRRYD